MSIDVNKMSSVKKIAYFRQRLKNRIYNAIYAHFVREAEAGRVSKAKMAAFLGKDPAQVTRLLMAPRNMTLDTISDLLLAMDAELALKVERFADKRAKPQEKGAAVFQWGERAEAKDKGWHVIVGNDPREMRFDATRRGAHHRIVGLSMGAETATKRLHA